VGKETVRTCETDVSNALIRPTAAHISVVSGKPHLTEVSGEFVVRETFPNGRAERRASLVESKGLESVLDLGR